MSEIKGQMCWYGPEDSNKILYVKVNKGDQWRPYSALPNTLRKPDYDIPGGSKGWATFQHLLKLGWELLVSPKARIVVSKSIDIGGLFRCCIENIENDTTEDFEGKEFICPCCKEKVSFIEGMYRWVPSID